MDLEKAYAVNEDAALNGRWCTTKEGLRIKVAKAGNPNFVKEVIKLQKPHIHLLQSSADTADLLNDITAEAMAKTILMDWEAEKEGRSFPYTWEDGKAVLLAYPDFREDVSYVSDNRGNFKAAVVEK